MNAATKMSLVALVAVAACVSVNKSVLSSAYADRPLTKEQVQVYFADDSIPAHERIAILNAQGDESMTNEGQMIDKLREEAGKLGANAIILQQLKDPGTGQRVLSAVFGVPAERKGQAIAIFVASQREP